DRTLNAAEALQLAGLDFAVEKAPLYAKVGKTSVLVPGKMATVRTDTNTPLGVVSPRYRVVQNADAFAFADAIVDSGGAHYETAAALFGGRQVFLSMELPNDTHVAGDPSDYGLSLLVSNGHDGKNALRADVTVERVV